MIASNVYRRTIDAFSMFEYIGKLRNDVTNVTYRDIAKATQPTQEQAARLIPGLISTPRYKIAKEIHKDKSFISAADIFNKLPHVPRLNSIVYITTYYVLKSLSTKWYKVKSFIK